MSTPVAIDIDGRTFEGVYTLSGTTLNVRYHSRSLSRELGSEPPMIAAKGLLRQLVPQVHDLPEDDGD